MNFFKKSLLLILLFFPCFISVKDTVKAESKTRPSRNTNQPKSQQKKVIPSYAQALIMIRTMPSNNVIINNTFAPEFINFVKSFNLSSTETKALLQAGINIHTKWTDNNDTNKKTLQTLQNSIAPLIQPVDKKNIVEKPKKPVTQPAIKKTDKKAQPSQPKKEKKETKRPQESVKKPIVKPQPVPAKKPAQPQQPIISLKDEIIDTLPPATDHFVTNNLVLLLDPERVESIDMQVGAMVQQALIALNQKAAPIIMTSNIFEIIMQMKQRIGDQNLKQLRATNMQQMMSQAQYLRRASNLAMANDLLLILLSQIDFSANNFAYYFHKSTPLVLIIPQQYIASNLSKALKFNSSEQAKVCGFNPSALNPITDITTANILKQLAQQQTIAIKDETFITHLANMFTIQKKNNTLINPYQTSPWIIYITGHGSPSYLSIGFIRERLKADKQSLDSVKRYPVKDPNILRWIPIWESNVEKYGKIAQGKESWPASQIVPGTSQIAGISAHNFGQLMTFFDKDLDTTYVHYTTCFAGGSNQTFVNETLSELDVDFIASTEGIHESYTKAFVGFSWDSRTGMRLTGTSFTNFFASARLFFTNPEKLVNIKAKKKDPILQIISAVSPESSQQNQPSVRFPSTESFIAIPLTKKTKVISNTLAKAHEIERNPFDMSNQSIDTIIINTPRINVPLNMGKKRTQGYVALVTPVPPESTPGYQAIHTFKEIQYQDSLQSFLFNVSYLNSKLYPQYFVINKLTGISYNQSGLQAPQTAAITNLIIYMQGVGGMANIMNNQPVMQLTPVTSQNLKNGTVGLNIYVAFELNNTIYESTFAIKDFENAEKLLQAMQTLKFKATPKNVIDTLAAQLITPQEMNLIQKPITLQKLAEFIDDKIDKQDQSAAIWSDADTKALRNFVDRKSKPKTK